MNSVLMIIVKDYPLLFSKKVTTHWWCEILASFWNFFGRRKKPSINLKQSNDVDKLSTQRYRIRSYNTFDMNNLMAWQFTAAFLSTKLVKRHPLKLI